MYFKTLVKQVAKEIIAEERKDSEANGYDLDFEMETIIKHSNIALKVKEASNYFQKVEPDLDDYMKEYGEDDKEHFDLWVISDFVLEEIDNILHW